ncbi:hypothetical protein CDAR_263731 [Caerostris darwini]|uniref:Uncharacterized protein n=1 Tax=Caerostris darwini TaxID=1538125 RepID=A0AAV4RZJ7_9ARAC|nr:hypothetical protein CDAR_263731 [Caerostris darwini]
MCILGLISALRIFLISPEVQFSEPRIRQQSAELLEQVCAGDAEASTNVLRDGHSKSSQKKVVKNKRRRSLRASAQRSPDLSGSNPPQGCIHENTNSSSLLLYCSGRLGAGVSAQRAQELIKETKNRWATKLLVTCRHRMEGKVEEDVLEDPLETKAIC